MLGYGKTITIGAITMAIGYTLMAIPTDSAIQLYVALAIVSIGNGLFKANISVLVGNLYSHSSGSVKDAGYNIFYMGINIGAFYAPMAASGIKDFFLHNMGTSLATAYNAGFAIAGFGMIISLIIFSVFKKYYSDADYQSKKEANTEKDLQLTPAQAKERVTALMIVFAIVIFFWMSFHQNGAALTLFARDYTFKVVGSFTAILFDVVGIHALLAVLIGGAMLLTKSGGGKTRMYSGIALAAGLAVIIYKALNLPAENNISPEQFQYFNPMFIVLMTPVIVAYFKFLNTKSKEPSSPGKIGLGMLLTAAAFSIMLIASIGLPAVHSLNGAGSSLTVSPFWLISSYFVVTIAELHLSPMGLSFVSKTAPAKMKGLMMGFWFGATAVGNYLSGFVGRFYQNWELWQFFLLLVCTSLFAAMLIRISLKKLRHATE